MSNKALVVIDIQNDITKHYRDNEARNGDHLYQTQQFVRRYTHLQAWHKRSRTCAGAQDCLGSYFR